MSRGADVSSSSAFLLGVRGQVPAEAVLRSGQPRELGVERGVGHALRHQGIQSPVEAQQRAPVPLGLVGPLLPEGDVEEAAGDVGPPLVHDDPGDAGARRLEQLKLDLLDVGRERPVLGCLHELSALEGPTGQDGDGPVGHPGDHGCREAEQQRDAEHDAQDPAKHPHLAPSSGAGSEVSGRFHDVAGPGRCQAARGSTNPKRSREFSDVA
jgi:hypothetical protein